MHLATATYAAGVVLGLWRTDGSPTTRVVHAVLWPIGPVAGVITVGGLLIAAIVTLAARMVTRTL